MVKKQAVRDFGVESIEIEKFRSFNPMTIPIGKYVTVISGQNGTGKSTLLGMLGQPFGLKDTRDVFGRPMKAKFAEMFKFSPDHDKPGDHLYFVNLRDGRLYPSGSHVQVKSYARPDYAKLPIRLVTGAKRGRGDGNIDYPVIYLGLRRTFPVGEIPNVEASATSLTNDECVQFDKWYKKVFLAWRQDNLVPVELTANTGKKATILMNADRYDYLANSAGQDNLGQILAALLSFQRAKESLGGAYRGGILLIDELDVTLFPASQDELFDLLLAMAKELCIQVVFTTHSFPLIEKAMSRRVGDGDVEVAYLRRRERGISLVADATMEDIKADLNVRPPKKTAAVKVDVLCEDDEAKWLLKKLLPTKVYSKCNVISAGLSCGELAVLSTKDIPSLKDTLFVVDGDAVTNSNGKIKVSKNLCVLPTGNSNPERAIYDALASLPDDDPFWESMESKHSYSKQMFVRSFEDAHDSLVVGNKKQRIKDKAWFRDEKGKGFWGVNGADVFVQWKLMNSVACTVFTDDFEEKVDRVSRRILAMSKWAETK